MWNAWKAALWLTVAAAVVGFVYTVMVQHGWTPPPISAAEIKLALANARGKPICSSPVNPNVAAPTDCIPSYLAALPPDPGAAGKATLDGIDADGDGDGMRDDVQRWIMINWGHSPPAVKGLTIVAQQYLRGVHYGDDLGKEETRKRFADESMRQSMCSFDLETKETSEANAHSKIKGLVLNTPERWKRLTEFDYVFANSIIEMPNAMPGKTCDFDADALAAAEGKQTPSQRWAESIEQTKRERLEEYERLKKEDPEQAKELAREIEMAQEIEALDKRKKEGASK